MNKNAIESLNKSSLFAKPVGTDGQFWKKSLDFAVSKVRQNTGTFRTLYPAPASVDHVYAAIANVDWTASFWSGMLWLAHEATGDELFSSIAAAQKGEWARRLRERKHTDTHDLGFLYTLSCVAEYRLTGNREARAIALKGADLLMLRYYETAGVIQAWGDLNDPALKGRIIIDCAMNLPLLFWASEETGNPYYREAATRHLANANEHLIRRDWSAYHTFYFDVEKGVPLRGVTCQGYSDDSSWARGQAWGIYGNALAYRYNRDPSYLEYARGLARYYLNRLPEDLVAYWDLIFTDGPEERDSSSAAIAACGLLELAAQLPVADTDRPLFENAGIRILASLATSYTSEREPSSNGILLHAVYNKPKMEGVDECNIWGDYFYMEGLVRMVRGWKPYW